MAQEFTIKSPNIEDKINQLLPSQGGAGAGVDISASTMVIPVVDLTESAEGSVLRQDLQSALSYDSVTSFFCNNSTVTIANTPGYWRVFGNASHGGTASVTALDLFDGTTSKGLVNFVGTGTASSTLFDFIVKLEAGDSVRASTNVGANFISGSTRQIADITGTLVNP